jgi:hypothetical protein
MFLNHDLRHFIILQFRINLIVNINLSLVSGQLKLSLKVDIIVSRCIHLKSSADKLKHLYKKAAKF